MKNKKVYIVEYKDYDEYGIDSIWDDKKLAEERLSEIRKQVKNSYDDDDCFGDVEKDCWNVREVKLNYVEKEIIYR